jgi:hypothetical protein
MLESIFNAPIIDQEDAAGNPIGYGPVQVRTLDKNLAKLNADSYAYFASVCLFHSGFPTNVHFANQMMYFL